MPDSHQPGLSFLSREGKALALLFLTLILFYFPVLLGSQTVFSSDTAFFNFPMFRALHRAYHEGYLPFWDFNPFLGLPMMSVLQSSVLYPPSLIFLLEDFTYAYNLVQIFHHGLLLFGVYVLMRSWNHSVWASLASALTAFLGGFFLSLNDICNHQHSAAWFPWLLLSWEQFLKDRSIRFFLPAIGVCVLQTLAGSPEFSILSTLLALGYLLFSGNIPAAPGRVHRGLLVGSVVAVSLAICLVQLLPTYYFSLESNRNIRLDWINHSQWSLSPDAVLSLFSPLTPQGLFTQWQGKGKVAFINSLYMGILPAFSILAAVFFFKSKPAVRFWWIAFWVGIFFALGKFNPAYRYFYEWMPLLGKFRFPEKFFFISAFSLSFLTGMLIDAILERNPGGTGRVHPAFWALAATLLAAGLGYGLRIEVKSIFPILLLVLFGMALVFLTRNRMTPAWFGGLSLVVILSDLLIHNPTLSPTTDRKFFDHIPSVVQKLESDPEPFRIHSLVYLADANKTAPSKNTVRPAINLTYEDMKNILNGPIATFYGQSTLQGTLGVEIQDQSVFRTVSTLPLPGILRVLERFNVRYVVSMDQWQEGPNGQHINPTYKATRLDALPRAFLVPQAQTMDPGKIVQTYVSESFDPRQRVLVSRPVTLTAEPGFEGKVLELRYHPNRVELRTRQKGNGFLVLLDGYYPGWHATVDGQEVEVLRGNHFFRTLPLSEGEHQVVFYYVQKGFRTGLTVSLGTLALLALGCAACGWIRRTKKAPPERDALP